MKQEEKSILKPYIRSWFSSPTLLLFCSFLRSFSSDHNLITGESVTYSDGGNTTILPVGAANPLFVIVISPTVIKLASSAIDALGNVALNITAVTVKVPWQPRRRWKAGAGAH